MNALKLPNYQRLVSARRSCTACPSLKNPSTIPGDFDSNHIGPWSWWHGDLDARLLVIGQDFADSDTFAQVRGFPGSAVTTNKLLAEFLLLAGIATEPPGPVPANRSSTLSRGLFLTNAVLCMKSGGMRAPISDADFRNCGCRFLKPTIELIKPRAIATLGVGALRATLSAYHLPHPPPLLQLLATKKTYALSANSRLFPLFHPRASRSHTKQEADWKRIGYYLSEG